MRKNILVILFLKEWSNNGNCLRIKNIFGRLKDRHNLCALYLDAYNNKKTADDVRPYFHAATYYKCKPHKSFLGKLINFIIFNPFFIIRHSDNSLFKEIRFKIKDIVTKERIDVIHVWRIENCQFVDEKSGATALCDICDSPTYTFKNEALDLKPTLQNRVAYHRIKHYERRLIDTRNTCFVSEKDSKMLGAKPEGCFVIPNGVDSDYFKPDNTVPNAFSLLFSGNMSFKPNIQAVVYFYEHIFKGLKERYPTVKWYIVGTDPTEEITMMHDGENIFVTGFVSDIRKYFRMAQVVICPMVSGTGIKNKLLEAMAMEKPVVSTTMAMSGIACEDGRDIIIADSPEGFCDKISNFFEDDWLRQEIGRNARQLVREKYSWEQTIKRYEKAYEQICRKA